NAALRGECRINQPSENRFHHKNSTQTKNATRHESRLNALLCSLPFRFNLPPQKSRTNSKSRCGQITQSDSRNWGDKKTSIRGFKSASVKYRFCVRKT
ncbi:hypothetical protein, partial [Vibrio furnissii]|uniref:hypothetical protein n=1 Tax=Vibrio furnissii TaxID=29494 RepID=UPI003B96B9BC